jgi:hypothetical protein
MLAWLIAIGALTIAAYILKLRGGHPELVRLCEFAWLGVLLGFSFGLVAVSHASDFKGWVGRQDFGPDWFQELVLTDSPAMDYAPVSGMVLGLGFTVLLWWIRRKLDNKNAKDV